MDSQNKDKKQTAGQWFEDSPVHRASSRTVSKAIENPCLKKPRKKTKQIKKETHIHLPNQPS